MVDREDNLLRHPGGGEVGKAGGYLVCHCKELKHHHENDWKPLRAFKPQSDSPASKLGLGGIYVSRGLEEEQYLILY